MIRQLNPLTDPRWPAFLEAHPQSSAFHTVAWLKALHVTYGYEPRVLTTTPPNTPLQNGLVCSRVDSWLTGRRLVSVPFADHCDVLADNADEQHILEPALEDYLATDKLKYVEVRPIKTAEGDWSRFGSSSVFCFHRLDLNPPLETLFANCHKDSTQRKIRRAEREGLIYEEGRSEPLLDAFYRLLVMTRRRHQVPPQPKRWFRNLIDCFGENLKIRIASRERQPVAAILTLRHKHTLIYKYGCSDTEFNNLGGTHLLFWKAIQEAKQDGLRVFDFGRSDRDNPGLITFKDRWGSERSELVYFRFTGAGNAAARVPLGSTGWKAKLAKTLFSHLPDYALHSVGELMYRHMG